MEQKEQKNDFLVQGSILAIAGILVRFIGMIYRVPLTRIIGREGMGYYNSAYEFYALALLVSSYSIPVAVSKLVSAYESKRQFKTSYRIFILSMIFALTIGFVTFAIIFFGADFFAGLTGWPSAATPLRVLAPTILVFAVMGVFRGFFQGKKTMMPTAASQIIEQIVNAIVSIVAASLLVKSFSDTSLAASYGAAGGTLGTFLGALAGLATLAIIFKLNWSYFRRRLKRDEIGVQESDKALFKMIIMTMLPIVLSQTIYQLSGPIDNAMFGNIMKGKDVIETERALLWEAYSNKYKWLMNVPVAISTAYGVSIVPSLIRSFTEGDTEAMNRKTESGIKLNMLIAIPAAVGLCVLANPVLTLLFGHSADSLSPKLMQLGSIAIIFFAYSTITNGILQGINHMRLPVIHAAISLGVHIVLNYVLIAVLDFGAFGLVIGNTVYALLVCILNWMSISKILSYKQEVKKTFLLPLAASIIMGAIALGVYYLIFLLSSSNTLSTIISIIFAIPAYLVLIILFRVLSKEELKGLPGGTRLIGLINKIGLHIF